MFASIIITTFNRMELLQASLKSLQECTYYPYELVIHDDGSDDRTVNFLMALQREGRISTLILNPPKHNRGQALAADRCYQVAQGEYVVKMEGDEQYTPGWLTKAIKAMRAFPEVRILSLQQFWHTHDRHTSTEYVTYPMWDELELASIEREGIKVSVCWCSPGGQFVVTQETYDRFGPWWHGHPDQETLEFRARCCPMFRLLAHSRSTKYPAVKPEDKAAHWDKYQRSAWLAVLDPPVISSHWGVGKGSLAIARSTLQRDPKIFGSAEEGIPAPLPIYNRGEPFGPMKEYGFGGELTRWGWIHAPDYHDPTTSR